MKNLTRATAAISVAALLAGCGGGGGTNGGAVPSTSQPTITGKLQLAVGVAYNAADASTGLNVVSTLRGTNGLSIVLADTPSISGPAGFTVPASLGGAYGTSVDAGTSTISSSPQVNVSVTPAKTTLGTFTGVFSYGLAPLNSDQQGVEGFFPGNPNNTPGNGFTSSAYNAQATSRSPAPWVPSSAGATGALPWWPQPFGAAPANQGLYLMGPPATPALPTGVGGFAGYSPGFTAFEATPVAGTYTENVAVTPSNAAAQSFTASATLASVTPLPAPVLGALTETTGGFSGTVTVGAGVTETLIFVEDVTSSSYFTVEVMGTGAQSFTLPGTSGIAKGDTYIVTPISFDYPALESAPPTNTSETPTIVGANGQADLSIGLPTTATHG